jgi:hypothetical protein
MARNGRNRPRRPRIEIKQSAASPEEAAAIAAAIEQFLHDTAPAPAPSGPRTSPWLRAAMFEAVGRAADDPSPWGDPDPWGRGTRDRR